ncbi:Chromosome partitioning protein ParA [Marinomonas gallaica]|uniref:Chromosome partitioning protein ParA n=1 Tax=Marinomonas gallaica TaxID=1806667 RepID=A0A1C3JRG5_9GAMM|nr:ParA family protein [Marinomonas gallaica]SBT17818.1 Chromosome partitioning protein ParA [Marinomonas gallaica]SBT20144.1 Chromosome partitioning protein ParA [Marinomonas gallaica]
MARIIAVTNQKGGVGKTTTCVNLAASLGAMKRRVLLIDLDPQGNATTGSGLSKDELERSVYDVLVGTHGVKETMVYSETAGFTVLPANGDLTGAEVALLDLPSKETRLRAGLYEVENEFDYILLDCPPSLNMLTVNALAAAQGVLIPVQCEYYALEGLTALLQTIETISTALNPALEIEGILRTMYDPRPSLTHDVSTQLVEHFGNKVFDTVIPRNIRLAEAPSYGLPVLQYEKQSRGAVAYLALAGEFIRKRAVAA